MLLSVSGYVAVYSQLYTELVPPGIYFDFAARVLDPRELDLRQSHEV